MKKFKSTANKKATINKMYIYNDNNKNKNSLDKQVTFSKYIKDMIIPTKKNTKNKINTKSLYHSARLNINYQDIIKEKMKKKKISLKKNYNKKKLELKNPFKVNLRNEVFYSMDKINDSQDIKSYRLHKNKIKPFMTTRTFRPKNKQIHSLDKFFPNNKYGAYRTINENYKKNNYLCSIF